MRYLLLFFSAIFLFSCSKPDPIFIDPLDIENKPSEYFPMEVGNYWIYDLYESRENLPEQFIQSDTLKIVGDTIIGADRFFFFEQSFSSILFGFPHFLGITNHHIVTEGGVTFLSAMHRDTLSNQPFGTLIGMNLLSIVSTENIPSIEVPIGVFQKDAINLSQVISVDVGSPADKKDYIYNNYLVKGIGPVWTENFLNGGTFEDKYISKLKEYHLN